MQTPKEIRRDLPPDLDPQESEALVAAAIRLRAERPVPAPGFRSELQRRLAAPRRFSPPHPRRYRALAAAYSCLGLLCLATAAIGLAGAGPFAAS